MFCKIHSQQEQKNICLRSKMPQDLKTFATAVAAWSIAAVGWFLQLGGEVAWILTLSMQFQGFSLICFMWRFNTSLRIAIVQLRNWLSLYIADYTRSPCMCLVVYFTFLQLQNPQTGVTFLNFKLRGCCELGWGFWPSSNFW